MNKVPALGVGVRLQEVILPRFFFHTDDGVLMADQDGTELPGLEEARAQAVSLAGAMLEDLDGAFWNHAAPWTMHVTDQQSRLLFPLHFAAQTPSGDVTYMPIESDIDQPE